MILAPAAPPPRGGGQTGKGRPRGGGQAGRGHPSTAQSGGVQPTGAPSKFYTLPTRLDALASNAAITGIISVGGGDASVLFDLGSTYSYVLSLFAHFLVISLEPLGTHVHVSTLVGDSVVVDRIYRSYLVTFCAFETRSDLLLLDMIDFEVILGMDCLSPYHTVLDCHAKTISLAMPGLQRLEWKGSTVDTPSRVDQVGPLYSSGDYLYNREDALDKVKFIQERFRTAQSRQKSYADQKVRDVSFMVGEKVLLKVSPMKGVMRFGKKGKLSPRFIDPFEVLRRVGEVAHELALPLSLSGVHPFFHVSMLRKCHADLSHMLGFSTIQQDESFGYEEEPVAIIDRQDRQLRSKRISTVRVQWRDQPVEEVI
ncbi:uncharacterized protein [Nicotiana sylvestris]|uniref:uncharacterized protein n=1 Tax=Nicotiana sylvestris TaxID=4096 RepID=UPI00388C6C41